MPQNKDFALRIEIIDECLRNRYRQWTLQNLIHAVNEKLLERHNKKASKRTIQNDLKYLKEEKLAPLIKKKDGSKTYFIYEDSNYSIKNVPVKEEEISYLKDAIRILKQVNDLKIFDDVEEIVNRLQNTINTNIPDSESIIQFERHSNTAGTKYIDDIFYAIKEKSALRITYQLFNALEPKQHLFSPYLLKEYRNRWFLFGRIQNKKKLITLALDRIKSIKNSQNEYIQNDLFDPETYFNNLIGVTVPEDAPVEKIEIKVSSKTTPYVITQPIHHSQVITKEYKNGDILIQLDLISNYELRSLLMSFAGEIEVLKPESLRNEMKNLFIAGSERYK